MQEADSADNNGQSSGLDLSPRTTLDDAETIRRQLHAGQRRWVIIVGSLVLVALGLLIMQFLRDATLFFRNVDEAIEQREELGDRRFRLQGRVIPTTVASAGDIVTFELMFNCAVSGVRHLGDPPELFDQPWIPVVLEGKWVRESVSVATGPDDYIFLSDRMLVNHTNEYSADNSDRVVTDAPDGFLDGCDVTVDELSSGQ